MKKIYYLVTLGIVATLSACNKQTITAPNFDATVNGTTFKVGDSVIFTFSGSANIIQFWSGEAKHAYANRTRTLEAGAVNTLSFTTATANLAAGNTGQTNNLHLMVSTDFSGFVDSANIRKANWTDITNRATIAANSTTTNSGTVNVSDFQNTGRDSVFVAFKYVSSTNSAAARARQYTIGGFLFNNTFPDGTLYQHNTINTDVRFAGFQTYSFKGTSPKDSIKYVLGGTLTIAQGVDGLSDEDWAITKGFNMGFVPPDVAVGIQNSNSNSLTSYVYKYTTPGTYIVTFVATNNLMGGIRTVIKQFTITVTP